MDLAALYAALNTHCNTHRQNWREIAKAAGIPASTFSRMKNGAGLSLDAYATCCQFLGVSLDTFTSPTASPPTPNEIGELPTRLVMLLHQHEVPEVYWQPLTDLITQLKTREAHPMIRKYCDRCNQEMTSQDCGQLTGTCGRFSYRVYTAVDNVWNSGDLCHQCIRDIITKTAPNPEPE